MDGYRGIKPLGDYRERIGNKEGSTRASTCSRHGVSKGGLEEARGAVNLVGYLE